jgi:hypothetical protein
VQDLIEHPLRRPGTLHAHETGLAHESGPRAKFACTSKEVP